MTTTIELDHLRSWIGRRETRREMIAPLTAASLAATLDHDQACETGERLPQLWHWIYFSPRASQSDLGPDGHPKLGGFLPPIPFPRRMWAGGRLDFLDPLRIGDLVERVTEIIDIKTRNGREGPLLFVTLRHLLSTERGLAIREEQDLVYRAAGKPAPRTASNAPPRASAEWRDRIIPDPRLLFRYSAVTFNTHRIHYDLPYARNEEGYPALVVHGPLTATLLASRLIAHRRGRLSRLAFRGQSPLFCGEPLDLCGRQTETLGHFELWAESPDSSAAMTATAVLQSADAD